MKCRLSISNISLTHVNFVVIEISNFERLVEKSQEMLSSSIESLSISVISASSEQTVKTEEEVDAGSVVSIFHTDVSQKRQSQHTFITKLLNLRFTPFFIKCFNYYLIIFILCLVSGSTVFLKYVYPGLSHNHNRSLHLDYI